MSDKLPVQNSLFDLSEVATVGPAYKPVRWYYIVKWRNEWMLHYIAHDGTAVWCEHDTRQIQPMLFNSAHTAKMAARLHGGEHRQYHGYKPAK